MKICPNCKTAKSEGDFGLCRSNKDGLSSYCRECNRARMAATRERNRAQSHVARSEIVKTCVKCKVVKSGIEFNVSRGTKDGLAFRCKACQREAHANSGKLRLKAVRAAWYARNKTTLKLTRAAYRLKNKARILARGAELRKKNMAKEKARHADYYRRNKAKAQAWHAAKWRRNKDKMYAKATEWRKKNPQKIKVMMNRRRARMAAALATLTAAQWAAILELYGNACAYCGRPGKMTMDHVVPISRGGGTTADNVVPACQSCNSSKNARTPQEWKNSAN